MSGYQGITMTMSPDFIVITFSVTFGRVISPIIYHILYPVHAEHFAEIYLGNFIF